MNNSSGCERLHWNGIFILFAANQVTWLRGAMIVDLCGTCGTLLQTYLKRICEALHVRLGVGEEGHQFKLKLHVLPAPAHGPCCVENLMELRLYVFYEQSKCHKEGTGYLFQFINNTLMFLFGHRASSSTGSYLWKWMSLCSQYDY